MALLIIVRNTKNDGVIRRPDLAKMSAQFRLVTNMVAELFFYFRKSKQICSVSVYMLKVKDTIIRDSMQLLFPLIYYLP